MNLCAELVQFFDLRQFTKICNHFSELSYIVVSSSRVTMKEINQGVFALAIGSVFLFSAIWFADAAAAWTQPTKTEYCGTSDQVYYNGKYYYRCAVSGATEGYKFVGTAYADYIVGTGHDDWIQGNGGDDLIQGEYGEDLIEGGSGNDEIYHWNNSHGSQSDGYRDIIYCGTGTDAAASNASPDNDYESPSECES